MIEKWYEVNTEWGWFRLDPGAYRDYLDGKLWIAGRSGAPETGRDLRTRRREPVVISPEADEMRRRTTADGFFPALMTRCRSEEIPAPYLIRMKEIPIEELSMSARASNCLKRAGVSRFGDLWELIDGNGLRSIRNLGQTSENETVCGFFTACYQKLDPREQGVFWQAVIDRSGSGCAGEDLDAVPLMLLF